MRKNNEQRRPLLSSTPSPPPPYSSIANTAIFTDFRGNREQRRPLLSSATLAGPTIYNSVPSTSRTLVAPVGVHGLLGVSGGGARAPGGVVTVVNVPVGLDQPFGMGTSSSSSSFGIDDWWNQY